MLTLSTNQWVILLLVLVLGWLLGLLTRSPGAKWRHRWQEQQALREAAEARAASAEARLAEIERGTPTSAAAVPASPIHPGEDDLALIRGIGLSGQARLREFGITRYRQIVDLGPREEADLEARIGARTGTIETEQWREQAALLANGDRDTHRSRFGG